MLISVLKTATVDTSTFSTFAVFRALLIAFLYASELIAMSFVSDVNRSCLSLYALSAEIFGFCFVTFAVTFVQLEFCVSVFAAICAQVFSAVFSAF